MGADKRVYISLVILVLVVSGRVWWWEKEKVQLKDGMRIRITARINQIPVEFYGKQRISAAGISVDVPEEIKVEYGDRINIIGTVKERVTARGVKYLSLNDQTFKKIENGSALGRYLVNIRQKTFYNLRRWLGGDEGELAAGILVGGSGEMSQQGRDNFRRTGVSHVVAASGYNVSVVAGVILTVAVALTGRRLAMWIVILGVVLYMFIAGMSAAVVRAGVMGILAVIGLMLGRKGDGYWLLVMSSLFMVLASPSYIEDIGFQLSVAATMGVLWASPQYLTLNPSPESGEGNRLVKSIREDFKITMAAIVMTTPLILHHFGNLSATAPVVNLLVVPVVPLIMGVVGMASIIGFVIPVFGQVISWLAWPVLRYMTLVVGWFGSQGWSSWEVGKIGWLWVAGYYLALVVCIKYWRWRR